MGFFSDLCLQISRSNSRGAAIMSILHERAENIAGDPVGQKLVYNLASAASKPYLEMVAKWIQGMSFKIYKINSYFF